MSVHPTEHHTPEHHEEAHQGRHPSFKQYVLIAIILFAITMVEFLIIVPKALQGSAGVVAPLVILSAVKFGIVIMFYMHLKFDARMFTIVFLAGLFLAFLVGSAAIGLFGSFQPTPQGLRRVQRPTIHPWRRTSGRGGKARTLSARAQSHSNPRTTCRRFPLRWGRSGGLRSGNLHRRRNVLHLP